MPSDPSTITALEQIALRLRIASIRATSKAGSGHPSSCCSAADIVAALFFAQMRFDPRNPQHDENDRFVLSKGHAAPLLYAVWAEAGYVPADELLNLRAIDSDLEGHPTPRLPFVDVATGSLGQGICAAVGIALNARRIGSDYRTYVLVGDGESAEGSVWEAAQVAQRYALDNLCAITDVNGFGQSRATQWGHDMDAYRARWDAFGWHAIVVDGHDMRQIVDALDEAARTRGRPTMILARTLKGKGVALFEGKDGWHGKPIPPGDQLDAALADIGVVLNDGAPAPAIPPPPARAQAPAPTPSGPPTLPEPPAYALGDKVATRAAYGAALAALGNADTRIVALDADVSNSTFSQDFEAAHADRFYETYIAEQVMAGMAMGLASRGAIPFPSTFAAFLMRAADFIRMAGIGRMNITFAGSHAGVSIGQDGPSQMALEDLAMMRAVPGCAVLYPSDAVSAVRLVEAAAGYDGMTYIRTTRPATPVIYRPDEPFPIGGSNARISGRRGDRGRRRHHVVRGAQGARPARRGGDRAARDRRLLRSADRPRDAPRGRAPDGQPPDHRRGPLRRRRPRRRRQRSRGPRRHRRRSSRRSRSAPKRPSRRSPGSLRDLRQPYCRRRPPAGRRLQLAVGRYAGLQAGIRHCRCAIVLRVGARP